MDKSSRVDIPIDDQRRAWNDWNAAAREDKPCRGRASIRLKERAMLGHTVMAIVARSDT